jgi:hypothetical protein
MQAARLYAPHALRALPLPARRFSALTLGALILALSFSLPTAALAGLVGSASVGVVMPNLEAGGVEEAGDSGYIFGGSLGWRFGNVVQWDTIEAFYMSANQSDNLGQYTANNYSIGSGLRIGSFGKESRFHPYASFGVAGSRTDFEAGGFTLAAEWGFEWNAGVGLLFDLTDQTAAGVRYRYRSTSIPSFLGLPGLDVNVNLHTIAVEFAFGD